MRGQVTSLVVVVTALAAMIIVSEAGVSKPWELHPPHPPPHYGLDSVPKWMLPLLKSQHGEDGNDGEKGKQGWQGERGDVGMPGNDSFEEGLQGAQGPDGIPGMNGTDGADGEDGDMGDMGDEGNRGINALFGGTVYTHWGGECGQIATSLSRGVASAPYHGEYGGGSNYLCLPLIPEFGAANNAAVANSVVVPTQLSTAGDPLDSVDGDILACSNCFAESPIQVMIPGTAVCPGNAEMAYNGYLMSARDQDSRVISRDRGDGHHYRTEYICVDRDAVTETANGTTANNDLIYHVHLDGTLGGDGPLTCAVCLITPEA